MLYFCKASQFLNSNGHTYTSCTFYMVIQDTSKERYNYTHDRSGKRILITIHEELTKIYIYLILKWSPKLFAEQQKVSIKFATHISNSLQMLSGAEWMCLDKIPVTGAKCQSSVRMTPNKLLSTPITVSLRGHQGCSFGIKSSQFFLAPSVKFNVHPS